MATQWETFPIRLEGGLITNKGRIDQGIEFPGSATLLQNYEADVKGGYTRIQGYSKFSDTAVPGTGQIKGVVAADSSKVLAFREDEVQLSTGTSWTSVLTVGSTAFERIKFSHYQFGTDPMIVVVDGTNIPAFFNQSANTMAYGVGFPADVIGAQLVEIFKSHIFYSKNNILSFSAPLTDNDFNTANGAGTINVGSNITGLITFRDNLFVFCLNKIFRLSGNTSSDFQLIPVTTNTGCLCGHTVQEVGGDIMYLSSDGVRYLSASERNNDFGLSRASAKIQYKVVRATNLTNCVYSSTTISHKNQYRLFIFMDNVSQANSEGFIAVKYSDQTVDDISWSTTKGIKVYSISKYQSRDNEYLFFSTDGDYVYRMENGSSFDGEDIESIFETPYMPITDPKIRKTFYKHTLYAKAGGVFSLTAQLKFDYSQSDASPAPSWTISTASGAYLYGEPSTTYGSAVYGTLSEEQFYNNILGSGFVVAIRYTSIDSNPPFNINFIVLEFRQNERR